ncbi:MAG: hypothetical protein EHM70_21995, partial [Chloroflexota bacterium]
MAESRATLFDVPGYCVALLEPEDTPALQRLLERCSDFSELVSGAPPSPSAAYALMTSGPEGKSLDDKFAWGIYTEVGELTGVLDAI